jgi:hypothetical protein
LISEILQMLSQEGSGRTVKLWLHKQFCDRSGFHPVRSLLILRAEMQWCRGDHDGLRETSLRLVERHRSTLGRYYLAHSAFVRGEIAEAEKWLVELLAIKPDHGDATYLQAACAVERGDREHAWQVLERLALRSNRIKTWQQLAHLVETPGDLQRLRDCHAKAVETKVIPRFRREISSHLAVAAMRGGDTDAARVIWRDIITRALESPNGFRSRRPKVDVYSQGLAEKALLDLKTTLDAAGIPMFLISGTLLGCVREGRLLGHDKDIDVGIWDDVPAETIHAALRRSGLFLLIHPRSPNYLRVRHVNGIPLDLFYHFREADSWWHASGKLRWHNSPFTLGSREFLGETFLVPADHDTYLTENYGDWRTPRVDFDSAFDTPNGEVTRPDEVVVHTLRMLHAAAGKPDGRVETHLRRLVEMGEGELVATFRKKYRPEERDAEG